MVRTRRTLGLMLGPVLALALIGCTQFATNAPDAPQTTVFPVSDTGRRLQDLYALIFVMAIVVFVGVEGFLLYTVFRFRRRGDELPAQTHGNTRLEIAWTVIPSIVLLIITVPTIRTIFSEDAVPVRASGELIRVEVTGHQWWWEFHYPDYGANALTANEFHLPLGRTAVVEVTSADVIHSFWVPKMGGKMDVVPTRVNHLWFTPEEKGEFYGQCVEFCGTQHANMRLRLFVDSPEDFDVWMRQQTQTAAQPAASARSVAAQGADLFQHSACPGCHTIRGTDAQGKVGPDLTHVGGRTTIAAGMLSNNLENLTRWISDPQSIKVNAKMPNLGLRRSEVDTLVAYLRTLQ